MANKVIYTGIFFPDSAKTSPLHVTYDYSLEKSKFPIGIKDGQPADVYIYGMCCAEDMNALSCYTYFGEGLKKQTLRYQHGNTDIPLHITLTHGVNKAPVQAGIILSKYMLESYKDKPNMDGYVKLPKLIKWKGIWGYHEVTA